MNFYSDFININIKKDMSLFNMTDEFFCMFVKSILSTYKNTLIVVDNLYEANKLYNLFLAVCDNVYLFPMDDFLTSEALAISPDLMIKRLETINSVINNENSIVITTTSPRSTCQNRPS